MPGEIIVHPFPQTGRKNAYIDLLYDSIDGLQDNGAVFRVVRRSLSGVLVAALRRSHVRRVVHIHWPVTMYGSKYILKSLLLLAGNGTILLILRFVLGCRIVWTMHNRYSHDYPYPWIDRLGSGFIFWLADAVIIQQQTAVRETHKPKVWYIPHGNYISAYGAADPTAGEELRRELGIGPGDVTVLSLGIIKPYKKTEELIGAFQRPEIRNLETLKLIIAGSCSPEYEGELKKLIAGDQCIILRTGHVPDEKIPAYMQAADYGIFWYDDSVLTSGGIMLFLSYGVPVLARRIPAADVVQPGKNGLLYDDTGGLAEILKTLPGKEKIKGENIISTVAQYDWDTIARQTVKLYVN